jgi:hypothetical protein
LAHQFYLPGGTAVALYLGNRFSYDLGFFCREHFVIDSVLSILSNLGRVDVFQAIDLYFQKFAAYNISLVHVLKSLFYFDDAEKDNMPNMIKAISWGEVKAFFDREGKALYHTRLSI